MKAPTPNEIRTAVKVLEAYRDQMHIEAAHSIIDLPDTSLGVHYAGRIGSQSIEKSGRVNDIITELNDWSASLRQQRGVRV